MEYSFKYLKTKYNYNHTQKRWRLLHFTHLMERKVLLIVQVTSTQNKYKTWILKTKSCLFISSKTQTSPDCSPLSFANKDQPADKWRPFLASEQFHIPWSAEPHTYLCSQQPLLNLVHIHCIVLISIIIHSTAIDVWPYQPSFYQMIRLE